MADDLQVGRAEITHPVRDQFDRLNVQLPNFTLQWKDWERYVYSPYQPGGIYGRCQYAIDPLGFVHLKGLVDTFDGFYSGRIGDLPRQAWPDFTAYVGCVGANNVALDPPVAGFLIVRETGVMDVYINPTGGVKYIALTGLSFPLVGRGY